MSKIVAKVFDSSKKIIRTLFKGSPNLITSADLNRQIDAFKYQLDQLDNKTGFISDIQLGISRFGGTLTVSYSFSYMRFKGCSFSPIKKGSLMTNFTSSAPTAYLCLLADMKVITYADDSTHEIAGAKFEDGTSMPAANQLVYKNERLVLTHAISDLTNLVGVIASFVLSESGNVLIKRNSLLENDSLSMNSAGKIEDFNSSLSGKVSNGISYDNAFSIIENRFSNIVTNWDFLTLTSGSTSVETDTDIAFRIQSGILYLNLPEQKVRGTSSRLGGVVLKLGDFPSDKRNLVLNLLNKIDLKTYDRFSGGGSSEPPFIPYGEFGCFPVFAPYFESSATSTKQFPIFGMAKVSLILQYENTDSGYQLSDAFIGAYVTCALNFAENNKDIMFHAPTVDWLGLTTGTYVYIPRLIGAVPLFGPS